MLNSKTSFCITACPLAGGLQNWCIDSATVLGGPIFSLKRVLDAVQSKTNPTTTHSKDEIQGHELGWVQSWGGSADRYSILK